MGYAARLNPRSPDGHKPKAFCSFHRCIRAVRFFGDDSVAFQQWMDTTSVNDGQRAAMEKIWEELHPAPLVTLHTVAEMAAL